MRYIEVEILGEAHLYLWLNLFSYKAKVTHFIIRGGPGRIDECMKDCG